ncbi:MAG: glycosyltransferase family 9 protein [Deltaproteobacteria bacterium]|nr:glycosyltransferase family 9 protein [Deltaproteobacteria bacterium]MBW2256520.1 glycosyltransferase family 9 protein [Deltaproteobacteria bacterium]
MGEGTVLLRRSSLGDVVLLGSVTAVLPGPVTVVTAPEWVDVASRLRGVHRVVSWPKEAEPRDVAAAIPPGRWVDLQGSLRSARLWLAAGRWTRRIHKHGVRRRLVLLGVPVRPRPPVTAIYARTCGVVQTPTPWIDLPRSTVDTLALIPGASRVTKRWPADRMAAVGRAWQGRVAVLGGPGEEALCAAVARQVPGATVVAERGFAGTWEVLARTRLAVGNDCGLVHLAGACGIPVVAVFGPTHPLDGFWVHRGEVVQVVNLGCRPCTLHGRDHCPLEDLACQDVPSNEVIEAVERVQERWCVG